MGGNGGGEVIFFDSLRGRIAASGVLADFFVGAYCLTKLIRRRDQLMNYAWFRACMASVGD